MTVLETSSALYRFSRPVLLSLAGLWLGWVQQEYDVPIAFVVTGILLVLLTSAITLLFPNRHITKVVSYMNPILDALFITVAIYLTGGAQSPLFVAYIPAVLTVSLVWPNAYSFQFVTVLSIVYMAVIILVSTPGISSASSIVLAVMVFIPTLLVVYFHGNSLITTSLLETQRRMNLEHQQVIMKHKARAYQLQALKAQKQAYTDPLTGLRNHGNFQQHLKEILADTHHKKTRASLLMLDIDNFKKLNDTYGHQFGDEVLKAVAQTLKQSVRATDIVARYGGEEMCVIFPNCDRYIAKANAERIRQNIKSLVFYPEPGKELRVTVSIGVADSDGTELPDKLIERADMALYEAKRNGKDRVVVFEER